MVRARPGATPGDGLGAPGHRPGERAHVGQRAYHRRMVRLKRAYDERAEDDGTRVLVDRVWPRGVTKERAAIDWWAKGLAPSEELRKWFSHDPKRFDEFAERYEAELAGSPDMERLRRLAAEGTVTLVYGARDREHNQAVVLKRLVEAP